MARGEGDAAVGSVFVDDHDGTSGGYRSDGVPDSVAGVADWSRLKRCVEAFFRDHAWARPTVEKARS
jgi:hypothetical protein